MNETDLWQLARLRLRKGTILEYDRGLQSFLDWIPPNEGEYENAEDMDKLLNKFAHHIFRTENGRRRNVVEAAKAGVEFYFPEFKSKLPRTSLSLQGWRTVTPSTPFPVCPEGVAFLVADGMMAKAELAMSIAVLLAFDCYLRAGDLGNMRTEHLTFMDMNRDSEYYAAVTLPETKRGRRQSVLVRPYYLAVLLRRLVSRRRMLNNGDGPLFDFDVRRLRKVMKETLEEMDLGSTGITPHSLRYGGATTDKMYGRLTDKDIQNRGRWKSDKMVQGYLRPDDLLQTLALVTGERRDHMERLLANPYRHFNVPQPAFQRVRTSGATRGSR